MRSWGDGYRKVGAGHGVQCTIPVISAAICLFTLVLAADAARAATGETLLPDRFPRALSAESFALDMDRDAQHSRVRWMLFSQTEGSAPGSRAQFTLPQQSARPMQLVATDGPAAVPPILARHATTAQFDGPFPSRRAELVEALLSASPRDLPGRQLDYAQFLIAHMMLPEARSVVRTLPADLDGATRDRAAGYLALVARLGGGAPADLPASWQADPLWPVVVAGAAKDRDALRGAFGALAQQSRAVATAVLPLLFDAALAGGDTELAAEILAAAPPGTDLDGTGVLDLMRGRLALAQGAGDLAFDTFARVAEGQDRAAAEARVALADMALERKDPALLPQISRLLQEGLPRWRGDDAALRLRVRLARVAEDMGDVPLAVEAMALILKDHPGTPEAALAGTRIEMMIGRLGQSVADPDLPLAEALHHVRQLDPALAGRGDWLPVRMALAARLADAGLDQAAKAEYASIAQSPSATLLVADAAALDALAVDQADLLLSLGDRDAATAALDRRRSPAEPAQAARIAALRLQAGTTAILPDPLLATLQVDDASAIADPGVQLALARVALATGQTDAALSAYDLGLALADQTERLHASRGAAEAGDGDRATRFARGLTGDRAALRQAAIESLASPLRAKERLSVSGASTLITAAADAGQAVDALLAGARP